ncbi:hypothetical protein M885DRAFT_532031 [Pelagophyceae sp. CCMP2097]|nr:hypothetical protein M885DRAFT_532031 [Pelagophyceae sp. CCMP2097]
MRVALAACCVAAAAAGGAEPAEAAKAKAKAESAQTWAKCASLRLPVAWVVEPDVPADANASGKCRFEWPSECEDVLKHFGGDGDVGDLLAASHVVLLGNSIVRMLALTLHEMMRRPLEAAAVDSWDVGGHSLPDINEALWPKHGAAAVVFDLRVDVAAQAKATAAAQAKADAKALAATAASANTTKTALAARADVSRASEAESKKKKKKKSAEEASTGSRRLRIGEEAPDEALRDGGAVPRDGGAPAHKYHRPPTAGAPHFEAAVRDVPFKRVCKRTKCVEPNATFAECLDFCCFEKNLKLPGRGGRAARQLRNPGARDFSAVSYAFTSTPSEEALHGALHDWASHKCARYFSPEFMLLQQTHGLLPELKKLLGAINATRHKRPAARMTTFLVLTQTEVAPNTSSRAQVASRYYASHADLLAYELAAEKEVARYDGVVLVPVSAGTVAGIEAGALRHEAGNSWHFLDAGRYYLAHAVLNAMRLDRARRKLKHGADDEFDDEAPLETLAKKKQPTKKAHDIRRTTDGPRRPANEGPRRPQRQTKHILMNNTHKS